MARVYATLIIHGWKTFDEVPAIIKPQVKEALINLEMGHLAEEA